MPQRKKRKKRRSSGGVYFARRLALLILFVGLVGIMVWKVASIGKDGEESSASSEPSQESQAVSEESSTSESEPVSENESEPESEAESEPESVSSQAENTDKPAANTENWNLLLVNSSNPIPDGYTDSITLEPVSDGYQVDTRIADSVRMMITGAREDGISLVICSAFRSPEKQEENFNRQIQQYLAQGDSEEEAYRKTAAYYAVPGYSEHHTGLAVDIVTPDYMTLDEGYANTPAANWLLENAHEYGFVLRYPKNKVSITGINFEPWHYRYVGVEHANAIKAGGYCLEEYINVTLREQLEKTEPQVGGE